MKSLSKTDGIIMSKIVDCLSGGSHFKLSRNKTYMALSIENIGHYHGYADAISLTHYGEQNGDLMRDPEMIFVLENGVYCPVYFRNDYAGVEQDVFVYDEAGKIRGIKLKLQSELAFFANTWMGNIKDQQEL
ncbi:MAG: hypothetical protein A2017_00360 [Lentisphaerae bacterium GWF2_44_16]|nr:MAG: hypothetical protein A2017_00360 [Lentisphaerae bacterium GWF2_44_16]